LARQSQYLHHYLALHADTKDLLSGNSTSFTGIVKAIIWTFFLVITAISEILSLLIPFGQAIAPEQWNTVLLKSTNWRKPAVWKRRINELLIVDKAIKTEHSLENKKCRIKYY